MPFVYHGTDAEHVDEILENGLQPREATGRSNWSIHYHRKEGVWSYLLSTP
jgi:RNA:NAD 2'-phosphotransferase (TPT1/KptA family)